jgi:prepilin-type N-terminal cleavage/methylation domain-containing protein
MQPSYNKAMSRAFTLLEMFIVISVIGIMAMLLLSTIMNRTTVKVVRINCTNNLKQVGLAFTMWGDDNGVYPMQYKNKTNDFDGPSYALEKKMYVYFQAMSNELNTPKIVVCPTDTNRSPGTNFFSDFGNSKVSYFVGLDANETNASMFVAGDRHLDNGLPVRNGLMDIRTNQTLIWTKQNHNAQGNLLLADRSVQGYTSQGLQQALMNTGTNLTRLALP